MVRSSAAVPVFLFLFLFLYLGAAKPYPSPDSVAVVELGGSATSLSGSYQVSDLG